jgi:hypothetical protein
MFHESRSDQYNAGPLEVSLTKAAIIRRGNNKTGTKQRKRNKSKILFIPASLGSLLPNRSLNHTGE